MQLAAVCELMCSLMFTKDIDLLFTVEELGPQTRKLSLGARVKRSGPEKLKIFA